MDIPKIVKLEMTQAPHAEDPHCVEIVATLSNKTTFAVHMHTHIAVDDIAEMFRMAGRQIQNLILDEYGHFRTRPHQVD